MPPKAGAPKAAPKPAGKKGPPAAMLAKLKAGLQAQKEAEERAAREAEEEERRLRAEEKLLAELAKREEEEREAAKAADKERLKEDKKVSKKNTQLEALERMRAAGYVVPDLTKREPAVAPEKPKPKPKPKVDTAAEEEAKRKAAAEEEERRRKEAEPADDWEALLEMEEQKAAETKAAEVAAEEAKAAELAKSTENSTAMSKSGVLDLRSPICCVLGHVDTGKTSLLDRIRRTNVQGGEAGGITQQIGATFFPKESLDNATAALRAQHGDAGMKVPGLLVIDTPGHESFTNLRSRGSSLCDIAVLVVDIMHGLEQQTRESLRLLRERKCPFIVALNKVDRLLDWEPHENMDIEQTLGMQKNHVKSEFDTRSSQILMQFAEEGFNAALHWKNEDQRRYVSVVPTSAKSGEGICDLLLLMVKLVQQFMEKKVTYKDELACTVLEVKPIQGFGTTIDVVLVNGELRDTDTIMVCGLSGPILTQIRALLTPQPMKEMRVKGDYVHHQHLRAAIGVKIAAQDLDEAVPGTPLFVVKPGDDVERMKKDIMRDVNEVLSDVSKTGVGVAVQSSTLGALEALLSFLKESNIPVSSIALGPLHKRHLMNTIAMKDKSKKHAVVLAFDVPISKEAAEQAAKYDIPIFSAKIIYHLFDAFTAYVANYDKELMEKNRQIAVFPVVLNGLTKIRNKDPIIVGCNLERGQLHVGTPLCVMGAAPGSTIPIGRVMDIEDNQKSVTSLKTKGKAVAIKISASDTSIQFGRQIDEKSTLVSVVSRDSIDALKESFRKEMSDDDWKLILTLKKGQGIP